VILSALPEFFLASMIGVILLVDLFIPKKDSAIVYGLTQLTLVISLVLILCIPALPIQTLFHDHFIWDPMTKLAQIAILLLSFFCLVYVRDYLKQRDQMNEYYVLALFSILGMLVTVSTYHLISLYLGLELIALPLYALIALQPRNLIAPEAAMKYFILGAIASALLLYGISLIYGACNRLDLTALHRFLSSDSKMSWLGIVGLVFVLAGLAFKLGAVPFHSWVPDVYQGASNAVTLLIGGAPKIAALILMIRFFPVQAVTGHSAWPLVISQYLLPLISVLSFALGNLVAIVQSNLKRMLAYSSMAHIGYALLGLVAGTPEGYSASFFYMIAYAIMAVCAFGWLAVLSRQNIEIETLADLRGLNTQHPWLAFMMLIVMFSMAGIPPALGFFAKLAILEALIVTHHVVLAVLAIIFAIIGAYYYLNVVKVMYFEQQSEHPVTFVTALDARVMLSINALMLLVLGVFPSQLFELTRFVFLGITRPVY
jgi:NADH-quinone oxidoreductase subunit N